MIETNGCAGSITTQLGEMVAVENLKISPRTLEVGEIMALINRGKAELSELRLLDELSSSQQQLPGPSYAEGLRPTMGMRRLINSLLVLDQLVRDDS